MNVPPLTRTMLKETPFAVKVMRLSLAVWSAASVEAPFDLQDRIANGQASITKREKKFRFHLVTQKEAYEYDGNQILLYFGTFWSRLPVTIE